MYIIADSIPHDLSESRVVFHNRETNQTIDVVSEMPYPAPDLREYKSKYPVHPHPRFCLGDQYITYTTTVRGMVDVAVVPVAALIKITGG